MNRGGGRADDTDNGMEATGTQPGDVFYRMSISASFDLKGRPRRPVPEAQAFARLVTVGLA